MTAATSESRTSADVRRFAYLQGPGKSLLNEGAKIDDAEATSSTAPPAAARGCTGVLLPLDNVRRLEAPYPNGRLAAPPEGLAPGERLGHLLLAANGLQRREPSHRYNDHRVVASGRAKFPVHLFTHDAAGFRYLDHYRHALVDVEPVAETVAETATVDAETPYAAGVSAAASASGSTQVLLAARYCDLPTPYQRMRASIGETELGINLRSLFVAADLCGVRARLDLSGDATRRGAALVRSAGPGDWSAPLVVAIDGLESPAPSTALPGSNVATTAAQFSGADRHIAGATADPTVREACEVSASRTAVELAAEAIVVAAHDRMRPPHGIPPDAQPPERRRDWAQVLAGRSAGRMPGQLNGFAAVGRRVDTSVARDFVAWVRQPTPHALLADIDARVSCRVALQRVGSLPTGVYELDGDDFALGHVDPSVMRALQAGFGHQPSSDTEIGIRHASMAWVFCADVDRIVDDFGPASWSLLQICLGWRMHGLCLAAAAHGLFARPARSYDERKLQQILHLDRKDVPVFMTVCGRPRFSEPLLDLRP